MADLHRRLLIFALLPALLMVPDYAFAKTTEASKPKDEKINVILHISKNKKANFHAAIQQANMLIDYYGKDNINIEIHFNGTGVSFVDKRNNFSEPIQQLIHSGVSFSACNNTLKIITKNENLNLPLVEGVKLVPYGVVHILEAQRKGYYYLKP